MCLTFISLVSYAFLVSNALNISVIKIARECLISNLIEVRVRAAHVSIVGAHEKRFKSFIRDDMRSRNLGMIEEITFNQ